MSPERSTEGPEVRLRLRPFRVGDEDDLAAVCLRTGDSGADATGLYRSPRLLGEVFALPYAAWSPETCLVLDAGDRVGGYVVCAPDTTAYEQWFRHAWWPPREARHRGDRADEGRDATIVAFARRIGEGPVPFVDRYPAHLHIDLLPEAQGHGWGRRLIDTLATLLRDRGVPGLQLTAGTRNTGAIAFYRRLGFAELRRTDDGVTFGMLLDDVTPRH